MGLRQTQDVAVNRLFADLDLTVLGKKSKHLFVNLPPGHTRGPQRLHLRGESKQPVWNIDVMEGLFAKAVAGDEHFSGPRITDRQREHAVEMLDTRFAPLLISREDYFRIAGGLETVAFAGELGPEFLVVVNLAVEDDPEPAVMARHRLVSAWGQIKDRETPEPKGKIEVFRTELAQIGQRKAVIGVRPAAGSHLRGARVDQQIAFVVGASMPDGVGGKLQVSRINRFPVQLP